MRHVYQVSQSQSFEVALSSLGSQFIELVGEEVAGGVEGALNRD